MQTVTDASFDGIHANKNCSTVGEGLAVGLDNQVITDGWAKESLI